MQVLTILQIIVSIALIILILMQERSAGGGLFGGSADGGFYQARRGLEKFAFVLTVILVAAFAILALANLLI